MFFHVSWQVLTEDFGHSDNSEFSENSEISDSFLGEFRIPSYRFWPYT